MVETMYGIEFVSDGIGSADTGSGYGVVVLETGRVLGGDIDEKEIVVRGYMVEAPNLKATVKFTRRAELS